MRDREMDAQETRVMRAVVLLASTAVFAGSILAILVGGWVLLGGAR